MVTKSFISAHCFLKQKLQTVHSMQESHSTSTECAYIPFSKDRLLAESEACVDKGDWQGQVPKLVTPLNSHSSWVPDDEGYVQPPHAWHIVTTDYIGIIRP